jgi:hypothetical protein
LTADAVTFYDGELGHVRLGIAIFSLLAGAALIACWNLFPPMQHSGHSALLDYCRLEELRFCISQGYFYPRWSPDFFYTYGYPLFHYYAPLSYYVAAAFGLFHVSSLSALKFAYMLGMLLAGLGAYFLAREYLSPKAAIITALLYIFAPYHLSDIYVRANLAEFFAFAPLPWILFFFSLYSRRPHGLALVWAGIAYAALILTHNITALLFSPMLLCYLLILVDRPARSVWQKFRWFWPYLFAILLGLVLSAFFFLPAMLDKNLVQIDRSMTEDYFHFSRHFVYLKQLVLFQTGFGQSIPGPNDEMSFNIGLTHIFFALFAFGHLVRGRRWIGHHHGQRPDFPSTHWLLFWLLLGLAIFFMLDASEMLWSRLPLLKYAQFPWRFLIFASLWISLLGGAGAEYLFQVISQLAPPWYLGERFWHWILAVIFIVLIVMAALPYTEARFLYFNLSTTKIAATPDPWLPESPASEKLMHIQDFLTMEQIRAMGVTTTARNDYLPTWVTEPPQRWDRNDRIVVSHGQATIQMMTPAVPFPGLSFRAKVSEPAVLQVKILDFPGWTARVNGEPWVIDHSPQKGLITLMLNSGDYQVDLSFENTHLWKWANILSSNVLAIVLIYMLAKLYRFFRK